MKNIISNMIFVLCIIIWIASAIGGLYVGGWVMFIKPIINAANAFDAGTLTSTMIIWTVLKCMFASTVGTFVFYMGNVVVKAILN